MRLTRLRAVTGAVAAITLLAGVSASAHTSAPPALKNGGTLTIALDADPDALDPTLARTFVGRMVFLDMCEKLYDLNAKLQIVPQLAASLADVLGRQEDGHDQAPQGDQVQRRHDVRRRRSEEVARPAQDAQGLGARE